MGRATGTLLHLDCSHVKLHQDGANPVAGSPLRQLGARRAVSMPSSLLWWTPGAARSRSAWPLDSAATSWRSSHCCRSCAAGAWSQTRVSSQTASAPVYVSRALACTFLPGAIVSDARSFNAAVTDAATTSKTSFAASKVTAESARGTTNLCKPTSASFNSPRSSIG